MALQDNRAKIIADIERNRAAIAEAYANEAHASPEQANEVAELVTHATKGAVDHFFDTLKLSSEKTVELATFMTASGAIADVFKGLHFASKMAAIMTGAAVVCAQDRSGE